MRTDNKTLIKALRILSDDIQSADGVANAVVAEAAQRLGELDAENAKLKQDINKIKADAIMGYNKNMLDIEHSANIKGEQGLRMMASFAAKTSKEYADKVGKGDIK